MITGGWCVSKKKEKYIQRTPPPTEKKKGKKQKGKHYHQNQSSAIFVDEHSIHLCPEWCVTRIHIIRAKYERLVSNRKG